MEVTIGSRIKHAWNAFLNRDPTSYYRDIGVGYSYRPDRPRLTRGNERSIVTSVYNRIALDCASISIQHVRLDDSERFLEKISSGLNDCLNLSANIDQTGRAFLQDIVLSMLDEGCVAIVPVDTDDDPDITGSYKIESMRTGKIIEWFPSHVKVRVYNERTGLKEDIVVPKDTIAIIENPLYAVINEPNSTMQRLIRKLNLLDVVDEQSSSGKLDLIIQLPYVIKTEARRRQAEKRRVEIERQLAGSKYGIAYADGTERITQLNRSVENNLMKQIEYLTSMLYSQLGITQSILDGSADEKTMLNYYNRTIEPIIAAIVDELKRKFLTKTAGSQKQSILFFRDPFKLVPVADLSEIADKFTRNEIMTSNEIRQIIGMKPSDDPKADELKNSNISEAKSEPSNGSYDVEPDESDAGADYDSIVNELLDGLEKEIDEIIGSYVSDDEEDIGEEAEDQKERIDEKKNTEIERLMAIEIPSGLSKEERAKRVAERNEKIAKLRDDASEDKSKVSEQAKAEKEEVRTSASRKKKRITEDTKEERADNSANAKSEREKVSAELKAAVTAAREAYKAAKENLDATYEDLYQQEFDKIASEYKAVKKRKRRK